MGLGKAGFSQEPALAGTGFRLAGCGSPISVWLWGSLCSGFSGFSGQPNGMEGGLHVLFLPFVLPITVLITHNRCTHKSSDHPQTDSQNITNTPPSIPFGHPTLSKTTNIHDPHTKTLTLRNFRPNGTPYPQEQDITKTNLYVIHTKKTLIPHTSGQTEPRTRKSRI